MFGRRRRQEVGLVRRGGEVDRRVHALQRASHVGRIRDVAHDGVRQGGRGDAIEAAHPVAAGDQLGAHGPADPAGGARHQDRLAALDIYGALGAGAGAGRGARGLDEDRGHLVPRQRGRVLVEEARHCAVASRSGRGAAPRSGRPAWPTDSGPRRGTPRRRRRGGAEAGAGPPAADHVRSTAGQRDRRDEQLRVRVLGALDHLLDVAGLDDRAAVEDDDVLADLIGRRQVVRDVDDRDAEVLRQLPQRPEDRRPERGVHHRHRLVGQDHARPQEERPRHHDPLALPAAELVREPPERLLGAEPDRAERVLDQGPGLGPRGRQPEPARRAPPGRGRRGRRGCRPRRGPGRSPAPRAGSAAAAARDIVARSCPRYGTWPPVGVRRPRSRRASVVLPLPLSPTTEVTDARPSPRASEKSRRATVCVRSSRPPPKLL